MAVHIRLTRVGATRRPAYRVIAIDSRRARDGRALEILGYYNPLTNPITIKLEDERIANWVARGARPSAAVQRLIKVAAAGPTLRQAKPAAEQTPDKPRRGARAKKAAEEPAAEATATQEAAAESTAEAPSVESASEPAAESALGAAAQESGDAGVEAEVEPAAAAEAEAVSEPAPEAGEEPEPVAEGVVETDAEAAEDSSEAPDETKAEGERDES